jgi:hypothetical protein
MGFVTTPMTTDDRNGETFVIYVTESRIVVIRFGR